MSILEHEDQLRSVCVLMYHGQISLNYQGKRLTVKYQNEKLGSRKFRVNGVRHNSVYDAVMKTETMILREDSLVSSKILVEIVD